MNRRQFVKSGLLFVPALVGGYAAHGQYLAHRRKAWRGTASSTLNNNLVSYWALNESSDGSSNVTRNDSVGSNNLTSTGNVASGTGKNSNGASFSQSVAQILLKSSPTSLGVGTGDFTMSLWLYRTAAFTSSHIVGRWASQPNWGYILFGNNTTNIMLYVSSNGWDATSVGLTNYNSGNIPESTWVHIVCGRGNGKIFISGNNSTRNEANYTNSINDGGTAGFGVGNGDGKAKGDGHVGIIDEVGFWSRELTTSECGELYNTGSGKFPTNGFFS